jgi:outer membrane beta-barrel protein
MAVLVLESVGLGSVAYAAEPEQVVVRNRLYEPSGSFELGAQAGFSLISRLVDHDNFQAAVAYNFTNEWAAEVFAGYALSGHTSIADQVTSEVASKKLDSTPTVDDFSGLWEMKWNVTGGVRWAPVYGKLSLSAEIPVHFRAYLGVGGGVAGLNRTSVTYCLSAAGTDASGNVTCPSPLTETRVSPVLQFGGGLQFFLGPHAALRIEIRDYAFPDQYQVQIDRQAAEGGSTNAGTPAPNPGFEHIILLTAGLSFII